MSHTFENSLVLAVDSHYGVYSPQTFVERYGEYLNLSDKDYSIMMDIEHDLYWEVWQEIESRGFVMDGIEYTILQNEDIWILPSSVEIPEDFWI
jgi:hypothetical protein